MAGKGSIVRTAEDTDTVVESGRAASVERGPATIEIFASAPVTDTVVSLPSSAISSSTFALTVTRPVSGVGVTVNDDVTVGVGSAVIDASSNV